MAALAHVPGPFHFPCTHWRKLLIVSAIKTLRATDKLNNFHAKTGLSWWNWVPSPEPCDSRVHCSVRLQCLPPFPGVPGSLSAGCPGADGSHNQAMFTNCLLMHMCSTTGEKMSDLCRRGLQARGHFANGHVSALCCLSDYAFSLFVAYFSFKTFARKSQQWKATAHRGGDVW